jgi:hypothetical protein
LDISVYIFVVLFTSLYYRPRETLRCASLPRDRKGKREIWQGGGKGRGKGERDLARERERERERLIHLFIG